MRVLFTTNIPAPYRVDFFNELGKLCDLTVLFERKCAKDRDVNWKAGSFKNFEAIFMKGFNVGADQAFCPDVVKYVTSNLYDIVVIGLYSSPTGMLAIQALKLKNKKFIISSDGGVGKQDTLIKRKIKEYFISSALAWLSTSDTTTEYLTYYGAVKDKVYVYPFTSVTQDDILLCRDNVQEKERLKSELGIREKIVVLSVGQFIYRKGYDVLLRACAGLGGDIGVYIVGGKPTEEYTLLKTRLGLEHVHFVDFMQKNDLLYYYRAANIFVLPTREDIWGLVINEAMAHGLPIVTTDGCVAGLTLVHSGENGYVVPIEDPKALYEAMCNAIDNESYMGGKSLEIIQEYTIEKMAQAHMEFFEKLEEHK